MKKKNIIYIITFGGCGRGRCKILVCHDFIEKKNNNESMWRNGLRIHIESKADYGGNFSFVSFFGKGKGGF